MLSEGTSSNLAEAILQAKKIEKNFLQTHYLTMDRDRQKIRLTGERHMETFLQITRKRHEVWHRHDKYFREALKKEKDRHERRKERYGTVTDPACISFPSLITLNSRPEPITKVERRVYQVLRASQKLLDESSTQKNSRPSTCANSRKLSPRTTTQSSSGFNSTSFTTSTTQSIDDEEYHRLVNDSLKRETYGDFVEHFIKFRPEFREQFAYSHQITKRNNAIEKIKEFNQVYCQRKDQRYYNLINSLIDFQTQTKQKQK